MLLAKAEVHKTHNQFLRVLWFLMNFYRIPSRDDARTPLVPVPQLLIQEPSRNPPEGWLYYSRIQITCQPLLYRANSFKDSVLI